MLDNIIILTAVFSLLLSKQCLEFLNKIEEGEKLSVLKSIIATSFSIAVFTKLFLLRETPSFFKEFYGILVSLALVIICFVFIFLLLRVYVFLMQKALSS